MRVPIQYVELLDSELTDVRAELNVTTSEVGDDEQPFKFEKEINGCIYSVCM